AAWPLAARAQQGERMRRIGILMPFPPTDAMDNMDLVRANAANLVELKPDVIVAVGGRVLPVLLQLTRTIPIVVPGSADPVGAGYVKSLAHPGGNITGFTLMEFSMFGKLLDLLKQLAPDTVRVGLAFNPDNPNTVLYTREIATSARPLGIEPIV